MKKLLVTIDGPAGAGKTTVSRMLAENLEYRYVDTGSLYRAVALAANSAGVRLDDDKGLERLCASLNLEIIPGKNGFRLLSAGEDITDRIRTPEITRLASLISAKPVVRYYLLDVQRNLGREKGVVFEGRDMGTVVFPDADIKFFLDASVDVRALRRYRETGAETGQSLEQVKAAIRTRDENDSARDIAPMKPATDAIVVDSSLLDAAGVVNHMRAFVENAG